MTIEAQLTSSPLSPLMPVFELNLECLTLFHRGMKSPSISPDPSSIHFFEEPGKPGGPGKPIGPCTPSTPGLPGSPGVPGAPRSPVTPCMP